MPDKGKAPSAVAAIREHSHNTHIPVCVLSVCMMPAAGHPHPPPTHPPRPQVYAPSRTVVVYAPAEFVDSQVRPRRLLSLPPAAGRPRCLLPAA